MTVVVIPAKAGIQLRIFTVVIAIVLGLISVVRADDILTRPVPSILIKQVACMTRALKTAWGIDQVRSRVERIGGMPEASVEYRDNSAFGHRARLSFATRGLKPPYDFMTMLGGLSSPGKAPETYGTDRIIGLWKRRCDVNASVLFV